MHDRVFMTYWLIKPGNLRSESLTKKTGTTKRSKIDSKYLEGEHRTVQHPARRDKTPVSSYPQFEAQRAPHCSTPPAMEI